MLSYGQWRFQDFFQGVASFFRGIFRGWRKSPRGWRKNCALSPPPQRFLLPSVHNITNLNLLFLAILDTLELSYLAYISYLFGFFKPENIHHFNYKYMHYILKCSRTHKIRKLIINYIFYICLKHTMYLFEYIRQKIFVFITYSSENIIFVFSNNFL